MSSTAAILARAIALAASFVSIPLAIGYLDTEQYGVFVTLTALVSMLAFADLGLGNGLLNVLSEAIGRGDRGGAAGAASTAIALLVAVALMLAVVVVISFPMVDWATLLGTTGPPASALAAPTAAVMLAAFLVGLPLGVAERIRLAFQEAYVTSVLSGLAAIGMLVGVVAAILMGASLPVLALMVSLPPVAAMLVNLTLLLRYQRPWLRPRLSRVDLTLGRRIARLGALFFVVQIAVAVVYQSGVIVAANVLGATDAATYAVTLRFFMVTPTFVGLYLAVLWPAYTEALARGDLAWVRRSLKRSIIVATLATAGASALLIASGSMLIEFWTGGAITPPMPLLVGAGIWATVSAAFTAVAMVLNAASVMVFQAAVAIAMAVTSVSLSYLLASLFGVAGIVWGTLAAYVLCSALPQMVYVPVVLRRLGILGSDRAEPSHA